MLQFKARMAFVERNSLESVTLVEKVGVNALENFFIVLYLIVVLFCFCS